MNFYKSLINSQKRTFKLHVIYSITEGIMFGAFVLNEFIFLKSLKGSDYLMSILFMFTMAVFVLLIFGNELLRRIQDKKKLLRITGLFSRLPLLLFFFFPSSLEVYQESMFWHYLYLGIILICYVGTPITLPTINLLLRQAYSKKNFGKLFGYSQTVNKFFVFIATLLVGITLDIDYYAFRYLFPFIGLFSLIGIWSLSYIKYVPPQKQIIKLSFVQSINKSLNSMKKILIENKQFALFELAIFIYGIAFMITVTVITFFLERELNLNYTSIAGYRNIAAIFTILSLPLFGKVIDKMDPRKFSQIAYLLIIVYIFFVAFTQVFDYNVSIGDYTIYFSLIFAFIFYGIFQANMHLVWNIGSTYYINDESESGDFQAVHLSLVGVRALFAPLLGVWVYHTFGYTITFSIAIFITLISIGIMQYSKHTNLLSK